VAFVCVVVVEPLLNVVELIDDVGHLTAAFGAFAIVVTAAGFTPSFFVVATTAFAPFWMSLGVRPPRGCCAVSTLRAVWRCWS
jgi:hypothetical protein